MTTERKIHSGMKGTHASRPLDEERRSRCNNLLTAAMVVTLLLLLAGLFAPVSRAQVPGSVQGWVSALEQTTKQAVTDNAGFTLDRTEHDFGQVALGDTVTTVFKVRAGNAPVMLLPATTDCGCTRAEFPKRSLCPGDTTQVKVIFVAKDRGNFRKTVHLRHNTGGRKQAAALVVRGTVK